MLNNMNDHTPFSFTVQFLDGQFDNPYAGRQNFNVFPFAGDFDPKTPYQLPLQAPIYNFNQTLSQNQNTIDQRRPRPEYENIYTMAIPLDHQYNGLDVLINKQFSHGLRTNRFD